MPSLPDSLIEMLSVRPISPGQGATNRSGTGQPIGCSRISSLSRGVAQGQGQLNEATARYQEALRIRWELEGWPQVGEILQALAEMYRLRGDWAKATEMAEQGAETWRGAAEGSG